MTMFFHRSLAAAFILLAATIVALPALAVDIQRVQSPGGIVAWLVEDETLPIITVEIAFRGGAAQDPEGQAGRANLMAELLTEGAGERDSAEFQRLLRDLSVDLSFEAGRDAVFGSLRTLLRNRDDAFGLLREVLQAPRFDVEPLERVRARTLSGLRGEETDPQAIATKLMREAMFGDHPYGRPANGTVDSVAGLTREDLVQAAGDLIARDNLIIGVVGAIDADTLAGVLDDVFAGLPESASLEPVPEISPQGGERAQAVLAIPQTIIRIGGEGLKRDDPDFIPAFIANHILGGGSFTSRLFTEVRERRGLTYSVGTGLATFDRAGAWFGSAATRADASGQALETMIEEIRRFAEEGPTAEELARAQEFLVGNYALRFGDSRSIARQLVGIQLDDLGIEYIDRRNDLVTATTLEAVRAAARRVFGGEPSVVTVGPQAGQ